MKDILCRQAERRGAHRPAQIAMPDGFTGGGQLLLPCCLIDGTAGAAALQKVPVRRVDDGIRCYLGDVVADHQKRHAGSSTKRSCIKYTRKLVSCEYHTSSSAQGQAEHFQRCIDPLVARKKQAPASV